MKYLFPLSPYNQQRQFEKLVWVYPVHLAMYATYLRNQGHEILWGFWKDGIPDKVIKSELDIQTQFLDLPYPDRILTDAKNKRWQSYGNYKYHPATHMMAAHGCWWGKCEFCVEKKNKFVVRDVLHVIEEIDDLIRLGFKEVFDDSGTFPSGAWLQNFCKQMKNRKIVIGCNMRMIDEDYSLMKASGFRMVLFGIESANKKTLDQINKGTKPSDVQYIIKAYKAGLDCHGTFMFSYPWESEQDAMNTLSLAHELLRKGYLKTAQASFYAPPDGNNNLAHKKYVRKLYDVAYYPDFWINKLKDIRNFSDVKYLWRQIKEGIGL